MSLNTRELVLLNTKYEMNYGNDTLGRSNAHLDILSYTYPYHMDKNCQLEPLYCHSLVSNDTHSSFRYVLCNHRLRYPSLYMIHQWLTYCLMMIMQLIGFMLMDHQEKYLDMNICLKGIKETNS